MAPVSNYSKWKKANLNGIENYEFTLECIVNCATVSDRTLQSKQHESILHGVCYKYSLIIIINKREANTHFGYTNNTSAP